MFIDINFVFNPIIWSALTAVGTIGLALVAFYNIQQVNAERRRRLEASISPSVSQTGIFSIKNSSDSQVEITQVLQYRLSQPEVQNFYNHQKQNLRKELGRYEVRSERVGSKHGLSRNGTFSLEQSKTFGLSLNVSNRTSIVYTKIGFKERGAKRTIQRRFLHRISNEGEYQPNYEWVEIFSD